MDEASKAFGGCAGCREPLGFAISMAFQPIIDLRSRDCFAYEALVRGANGEGAGFVFDQVRDGVLYGFDQACRIKAVEMAATLGMNTALSINFMPNAVYEPRHCIQTTLDASRRTGFPLERIIFEASESERITRQDRLIEILREYQTFGFRTAIDDFGAGYAGLSLLANFQPDLVKLDMELVRGIDASRPRQAILKGILEVCRSLGVEVIAEGVETVDEMKALADGGVYLMQGYYFARPGFETLPGARW